MKTAEAIKQEFKELNAYLDDLYNNHKNMDAGNLWIQFTDKFNAFEKTILQSYASHPTPMSAEPTVQQLRDAAKNNPDTFLAGALYVIDNYKLNSHPMSAEQVEILKLSAHFLNKYGGELSNNTCNDTDSHVRDTINRIGKDKFMKMVMDWGSDDCEDAENYDWIVVKVLAHYIKQLTSTTPSVKADGCEHDCVAKDMYWKQCHKCGMILPIN